MVEGVETLVQFMVMLECRNQPKLRGYRDRLRPLPPPDRRSLHPHREFPIDYYARIIPPRLRRSEVNFLTFLTECVKLHISMSLFCLIAVLFQEVAASLRPQ